MGRNLGQQRKCKKGCTRNNQVSFYIIVGNIVKQAAQNHEQQLQCAGSNETILSKYKSKNICDFNGAAVYPGFNDTHCHTYLTEFAPVSIKMAKEQNLSLNPSKISGVCGRLMCCLTNEEQTYEELNSRLPVVGDTVTTPEKLKGDVQSVNVLRQLVKVVVTLDNDEKEVREYRAAELRFKPRRKKKDMKISKEEMAQLKALEEKNGASKLDDK